jgi:hypothetical protein
MRRIPAGPVFHYRVMLALVLLIIIVVLALAVRAAGVVLLIQVVQAVPVPVAPEVLVLRHSGSTLTQYREHQPQTAGPSSSS